MNRRRFLAIAATALGSTAAWGSRPQVWRGSAMGAEAQIILAGASLRQAAGTFAKVQGVLRGVEEHFSLHRDSALTRLNRIGRLAHPPPAMLALFRLAGNVHAATGGVFDPTIQPVWMAVATSGDVDAARKLTGWNRVRVNEEEIALDFGMELTFNGIAQGHAADEIARLLREEGYTDVLIDTGEIFGLGHRPDGTAWRAAIALPDGTEAGKAALFNRALATSAPLGTQIGAGLPHIINPRGGAPLWKLAAVSAPRAALADALSTAFCLMERPAIKRALAVCPEARLESLV